MNGLLVRQRENDQQSTDCQGERDRNAQGAHTGRGKDNQHFLGGIGHRRHGIRRKNSQPHQLANGLVWGICSLERTAHQPGTDGTRGLVIRRPTQHGSAMLIIDVHMY